MEKHFPQRSMSHQLEAISETFFENSLPPNWKSYKPEIDYGVDLVVEIFEGEYAKGHELLVQLKSTQVGVDSEFEIIRLNTATYNYLWNKLQVVMLVKYVAEENQAYWLLLKEVPEPDQGHETFSVRIPKTNRISSINWELIQQYVRSITDQKLAIRRRSPIGNQGKSA